MKKPPQPRRAKASRPAPAAVARLCKVFPEVWAWYELLAAARGLAPTPGIAPEHVRDRSTGSG